MLELWQRKFIDVDRFNGSPGNRQQSALLDAAPKDVRTGALRV
jgi:hypothetical protein